MNNKRIIIIPAIANLIIASCSPGEQSQPKPSKEANSVYTNKVPPTINDSTSDLIYYLKGPVHVSAKNRAAAIDILSIDVCIAKRAVIDSVRRS